MNNFKEGVLYVFRKELVTTDDLYDRYWLDKANNMPVLPTNLPFLGRVVVGDNEYFVISKWCKPVKPEFEDKVWDMYHKKLAKL